MSSNITITVNNGDKNLPIQPNIVYVRRKTTSSTTSSPSPPKIPNYKDMSPEQQVAHRRYFLFQFDQIRQRWRHIRTLTKDEIEQKPLDEIHNILLITLRQIEIDNKFQRFRSYFVISLLVIHIFGTYIMKLDCDGLVKSQLESIYRYEQYLYELSEKMTTTTDVVSWPPELKLFLLLLFNVAIYITIRYLTKYIPANVVDTVFKTMVNMGNSPIPVKESVEKPSPDLPGLDTIDNTPSVNRPAMDQLIESASDIISRFSKSQGNNGNVLSTLVSGLLDRFKSSNIPM
jgi:hypothetical protein